MKYFYCIFSALFIFVFASATPLSFDKDPFKDYQKAKDENSLEKLSVQQRINILNSLLVDVRSDSIYKKEKIDAKKADIIKEIITTTPADNVEELFHLMGSDYQSFQTQFHFLPFEYMSMILNYTRPVLEKNEKDSKIFNIPYDVFQAQLENNIAKAGDNLFQSHYTDFCGKVAVVRLWIKRDSVGYKKFMTDLYKNGRTTWNGKEFITPQSVIDAINHGEISEDPDQKILFRNPDVNEKMPDKMDMVLYLTFASTFHTFPFNAMDYDPDKHAENSAWAGASIDPELSLLQAVGFNVEKFGDNFRGITESELEIIKSASENYNYHIMLLVNSSMLDTCSGACKEYNSPRPIEHKNLGTHWITVTDVDEVNDKISFWEYGRTRDIKGIYKMKEIVAGGIIIGKYNPK